MTATILSFPTLAERDALEFKRFGTSTYIRAIDEAGALLQAAWSMPDRSLLRGRAEAFANLVERLAVARPETVGNRVALPGGMEFELRAVPGLLAAMLKAA